MDDRDDFTNGHPMRMRKSRKRRSLQKRLMGSTESLNRLDELAASRASKIICLSLFVIGYRHDFANVFFFFFLIFIFPFELLSPFVVLKYRAILFAPRFVNTKTVPILSAFFLSNVIF